MTPADSHKLAFAMSGGGARAAYQAGVMLSIGKAIPDLRVPILTGVSAGAINAASYASSDGNLRERAERLADLWRGVTTDQVFEIGVASLTMNAVKWFARLVSGGLPGAPVVRGLVDTSPLRALLRRVYDAPDGRLAGVERNVANGSVDALAITASSYTTGESVTWISSGRPLWERPGRRSIAVTPDVEHVMASSALPLVFPAIQVENAWYGDGGMRLLAPLAPAIHLGATRILAVSTRFGARADTETPPPYPPPAQVGGAMLEAVFLDTFDADAVRLEQINSLIERVPPDDRLGLRKVELLVVRPSTDVGRLVARFEHRLPRALRFLLRGLGTHQSRHHALLSLMMFERDYLAALIDLGEKDTDARPEIAAFLRGGN